ncbi:hypothetical protein GCM10010170_040890 [Dactylosporangium salmoneum]|uniref:Uncharacterized protein n=1 Tax=Dactylosporangium salmoneum TaxID=53361 RepID=A0ABN3GGJ3_9ACTN
MCSQSPRPESASRSWNGSMISAAMTHSTMPATAKGTIGGSSGLGGWEGLVTLITVLARWRHPQVHGDRWHRSLAMLIR